MARPRGRIPKRTKAAKAQKLRANVAYGSEIQKVECTNHALKNYTKNLLKVKKDKHINQAGRKMLTTDKINLLTKRAKCSVYEHSKTEAQDVQLLRKDLAVGLHHVFEDHKECRIGTCNSVGETSNSLIEDLKTANIYNHLKGNVIFNFASFFTLNYLFCRCFGFVSQESSSTY